jgi:ATP-dependent RNA helicase SUPV3L1/SUV3
MQIATQNRRVLAVLGPTNTGKTHFAMERMLGHASGMIGFPLRLLARENYDRAVRQKGAGQVALITGEEKIIPPGAKYFLCTVESMPQDRLVAFLGIDEIQMCADPDRGHVFTDRLLHARGSVETIFMGAETIKPLLKKLVPEAEYLSRPRFSTLTYTGAKKITRLPPRSAIVAFSTADVYTIAELVRRQRGGAAVVLGALSPRTRNAQVELYQNGEVDYLVATDAIGMGLNMDVNHVSFAETRKFDGRHIRRLQPAELAQIAGRAGRHMNDGTFGTAADIAMLDADVIAQIENHDFDPLDFIYWRNPKLNFNSIDHLRKSLAKRSDIKGLVKSRKGDDEMILQSLAGHPDIARKTTQPDTVRLLWEVCQIPDFGGVLSDGHARLLARIYRFLMADGFGAGAGRLPNDWVAAQVGRVERTDGDIETLIQRIANIRTWTYISHRADWLDDAQHWQERTRAAEDQLSDILHERLTQRFLDRRSAQLVSRLKDGIDLLAAVKSSGEVIVEGHAVGKLQGFRFTNDTGGIGAAAKAVSNAAVKALRSEIPRRLRALEDAPADSFSLNDEGLVLWHDQPVGRLSRGASYLKPAIEPLRSDLLDGEQMLRLRRALLGWVNSHIADHLKALTVLQSQSNLSGAARGIIFQVAEGLGSIPRNTAQEQIHALKPQDRKTLRRLGLIIGRYSLYMPALLKPAAVEMRRLLWLAFHRPRRRPPLPHPGRISLKMTEHDQPAYFEAIGFCVFKTSALRADIVERLAEQVWSLTKQGPTALSMEVQTMTGCNAEDLSVILHALGYRRENQDGNFVFHRTPKLYRPATSTRSGQNQNRKRRNKHRKKTDHSPFAKLKTLQNKK